MKEDSIFMNDPIVRSFMKEFERLAYAQGNYSQVFEDFLDFCIYYLSLGLENDNGERLEKTYKEEGLKQMMKLFEMLGEGSEDFQDLLGTIYMEISSQYKASAMGQFFTPGNISAMVAEMIIGDIDTEREGQKIGDPSCGSGIMLLKAAKKFGDNRSKQVFIGSDLDRICCKMCAVNMSLNTIPGAVYHMNTLSLEHYGAYTLSLQRLLGKWMVVIQKWPSDTIQRINEKIKQDFQQSAEQQKEIIEAERERQRIEQIEAKLKAKSAKKGFASTLFD
jgi:N-6 DNA Methylase